MKTVQLTKRHYLDGLKCPRRLWWEINDPEAQHHTPDPALAALLEQGRRVGVKAREYVPGGVLIDADDQAQRIRATKEALLAGPRAIYEAAFEHGGVSVVADILERTDGRCTTPAWNLVEVKSSSGVKDEHLPDVALQLHVIRSNGLAIDRAELMHLNRECRHPDLSNLFTRADVTADASDLAAEVPVRLDEMRRLLRGPSPETVPGECEDSDDCPLEEECWAGVPVHSIWTLYRAHRKLRDRLEAIGVQTVDEIPDDVSLTEVQQRQRRAVKSNELVVDRDGLRRALATLSHPIAYLDFETIAPAIPVWPGMRPFDAAPVQLSVHVDPREGVLHHYEWLAEGADDPRQEMARRVVEVLRGTGSVVVYCAQFERRCLRDLAACVPELAGELERIASRLWDLHPVIVNHVYHPDFGGSFGLKSVLPALVPREDAGYDGMEIANGAAATWTLEELLLGHVEGDPESLRRALLDYCRMDTMAMVRLVERLRGLG